MNENPAEDKGLQQYLSRIAHLKPLTRAKEHELIPKAQAGDETAMNTLIKANLKFVVKVASRFQGKGLSLSELISEGNIGLIKAIKRFDSSRNTKLITYAVWWIQQAIQSAVYEKNRLIRLPGKTITTLNRIEDARQKISAIDGTLPKTDDIAEQINMSNQRVKNMLQNKSDIVSLDAMSEENDALSRMNVQLVAGRNTQTLSMDPQKIYYNKRLRNKINERLQVLSERDAHIITEYFGFGDSDKGKNFAEIARELGLSRERVRQIFKQILEDLRKEVVDEVDIDYLLDI